MVIGNNFAGHTEQETTVGVERSVLGFGAFGGYREAGSIVHLDGRTAEKPGPENRGPGLPAGGREPDAQAPTVVTRARLLERYIGCRTIAYAPSATTPDVGAPLPKIFRCAERASQPEAAETAIPTARGEAVRVRRRLGHAAACRAGVPHVHA